MFGRNIFFFIHHDRQNAIQLNKLNTTKQKKEKNGQVHIYHIQYLSLKHFIIASQTIERRTESGFAIMYTFTWHVKINKNSNNHL